MENATQSTQRVRSLQVVHSIHTPVGARSFVMPMVKYLNQAGISTQLWVENRSNQSETIADLTVPKQFVESDLVRNPIALIARLVKYRRQLRIDRPKVIHAHQTRASIIPLLAAYLEKIPVRIYQNHGLPYLGHRGILRWFLRSLDRINIKLATHVLLVSHSNLVEARVDGLIPANRGCVLASGSATGIDPNNFKLDNYRGNATKRARQKLNIPESAFVLAYVGRPFKRKGFHLLLKAWQQSGLAHNNNYLIIAGCTATECDRVFGYPIPGVKGLGYLNDLTEFYAACDVVTLPSEHEGFPYSLLEGAAAGKPLLGTNIPGIKCAIKDRITGLLIPANDEIELVKAMIELAEDPDLRFNLGENARLRIEREFTTDIVLGSLLEFYTNELDIRSNL